MHSNALTPSNFAEQEQRMSKQIDRAVEDATRGKQIRKEMKQRGMSPGSSAAPVLNDYTPKV